MRYLVKWVNGNWRVFDRWFFGHGEAFPTRKLAEEAAVDWNADESRNPHRADVAKYLGRSITRGRHA